MYDTCLDDYGMEVPLMSAHPAAESMSSVAELSEKKIKCMF